MSPTEVAKSMWTRWRITIAYLLIISSFTFTYWVKQSEADRRVKSACASVTQVKDGVLKLAKPVTTIGTEDAATRQRITEQNLARREARKTLAAALACRR